MIGKKTIKEHFVPKVYLKNFSTKKGRDNYITNCFDKSTEKSFPNNTKKIAYGEYFYDSFDDDDQILEKTFCKLEGKFNTVCTKLIKSEDLKILDVNEKEILATFIATQMMRTERSRETLKALETKIKREFHESERISKDKTGSIMPDEIKETHIEILLEVLREESSEIVDALLSLDWTVVINNTSIQFLTSDNPVVLDNLFDHSPCGSLGLLKPGINLYFPLTPNICLLLFDPFLSQFSKLLHYDISKEKIIISDDNIIIRPNHLQVKWSKRFLFSKDGDFSVVKKMMDKDPELKD